MGVSLKLRHRVCGHKAFALPFMQLRRSHVAKFVGTWKSRRLSDEFMEEVAVEMSVQLLADDRFSKVLKQVLKARKRIIR